ncbi:MAG: alpha/beta fold hydrolase [Cytophagales bacterium]|nr:alpha/beta fold hydrolase [Armatimonadota bacterium]
MTSSRPFVPRPRRWPRAEPSLDWRMRAAVALFGAARLMNAPSVRKRLELTGLSWGEIAPVLARIRTVEGWARAFDQAADAAEKNGEFFRAAALAFLGQLILSPFHPRKAEITARLRRCQIQDRSARSGIRFERVVLAGGALVGYLETPVGAHEPLVVLMPPLASIKEELTVLADPLLEAGHPVLRLDLPGQGESPPPLQVKTELLLMQALDELGVTSEPGVLIGGISLGSYFALRLAGADRGRVRGVFGVSPPAIITPEQWAKQPEIIWQYLDLYFATDARKETLRLGMAMTLDDVVADITCPVLLYHAANDGISLPDRRERYQKALAQASLTDQVLPDTHGCTLHLKDPIAPEVVAWAGLIHRPFSRSSSA